MRDLNLETTIKETISWIDNNPSASTEEFQSKQTDFSSSVQDIVVKFSGENGNHKFNVPPNMQPNGKQPKVEEVD